MKWLTLVGSFILVLLACELARRLLTQQRGKVAIAEKQASLLEELTAQVRHDVASPITALKFIAERAPLDPSTKAFLRQAVERTDSIFGTLARSDAEEPFSLQKEIEKILAEHSRVHSSFPRVHMDVEDVEVIGPRVEIDRAISNILNNSREAEAQNLYINLRRTDKSKLELTFDDDGAPIPETVLERFGQRGVSVNKQNGSGLGLFHLNQLVKKLGGEVRVKASAPKITICLPT